VLSWALYDWANSVFAVTVISAFFPLFLKQYWSAGDDPTVSTFQLGVASSGASLVVALLAPVLGAIADSGSAKKKYLVVFTALAIVMTGALPLVARGDWLPAIALFAVASIGFSASNIFYDALIVEVARDEHLHYVSALGFSLGYLGGGLLFALNVMMTLWPQQFGLADAAQAVRVSFVLVAAWWGVFTIPLLVFVKEAPRSRRAAGWTAVQAGLRQLGETMRHLRALRPVWLFLLAYWCYIDGVHTIARMAVDYGMALGFDPNSLIVALLITQFVGFPAALAFGHAGERLGARPAILTGIAAYATVTVWSYFMTQVWEFYVLAVAIGLVQGGVQSLSRSLYARLIPAEQAGEFFGFYNMLGKFAAVLGPAMVGVASALSGSPRLAILAILVLFIAGAGLLYFVDERPAVRPVRP
jgi:UMF1 family MFS transporter